MPSPRRVATAARLALLVAVLLAPLPSRAETAPAATSEQRAYAEWTTPGDGPRTRYFADASRLTRDAAAQTFAVVGADSCARPSARLCIGALRARTVSPESFDIDPSMSTGRLDVRLWRSRQVVEWQGKGLPNLSAEGDAEATRPASASGSVLRHQLQSESTERAGMGESARAGGLPIDLTAGSGAVPGTGFITTPWGATPGLSPAGGSDASRCWSYRDAERKFAKLTNAARSRIGHRKLRLDKQLSRVARVHTSEMVERTLLFHTPSNVLGRRVTRWTTLGENVGFGGSTDALQKAFMNSPEHRANILYSPFRHVGIGTRKKDGLMWVTVIFQRSRDPGTRLSMPRC
jgi:hypothetical protein